MIAGPENRGKRLDKYVYCITIKACEEFNKLISVGEAPTGI